MAKVTGDLPLLGVRDVGKRFPGVVALDGVSFSVLPGEIHAIVGENGAGKSTLVRILAGIQPMDQGSIEYLGASLRLRSPRDAIDRGINTIHQELHLAPHLNAAENIFLGRFPLTRLRLVDRSSLIDRAERLLERLGVPFDVRRPVSSLSIAQRQIVEIAKALVRRSRLLILDEPSAVLGRRDLGTLFAVLRILKSEGTTILYISHRLEEIFELADRVTVLRDGRQVGSREVGQLTVSELIEMMIGRAASEIWSERCHQPGEIALAVRGLSRTGALHDINLEVRRGEIVGLVGKVGSGRTELARAIFGADRADRGEISVFGRAVRITSPRSAVLHGVGLVPEDRNGQGLLLERSILENITIANLRRFTSRGFLKLRAEARAAAALGDTVAVRTPALDRQVKHLSGGNQQKVVLAKWLNSDCEILIFDEPTRGIDVGAKLEIYAIMRRMVRDGKAILMISSDVSEILGMADRIVVMKEGAVAGTLTRQATGNLWPEVERLMDA